MRLVHLSDIHVYDPSTKALQKAKEWGKIAIALAAVAGVMRAGSLDVAKDVRDQNPRLFRMLQGFVIAGLSGYLVRKLIDKGHHRAYRALNSEAARRVLEADLQSMSFDHMLVTGDVALTPSGAEFERAAEFLRPYWDRLNIVPGNHDVPFIEGSSGDFQATFDERLAPFPYVRDLGEGVALIGVDSTVRGMIQDPWAILSNARGRVSPKQLQGVRRRVPDAGIRLLAMHHHMVPTPEGPGGLVKRIYMGPAKGSDFVRDHLWTPEGVDLVLHGHQHWNYFGPGFLCAGTSTLVPDGGGEHPTYNIYEFDSGKLVEIRRRTVEGERVTETRIPVEEVLPDGD